MFVGDPTMTGGFTTVWTDDITAMDAAVRHLAGLGHQRLVRVAGLADLSHVQIRDGAFTRAAAPVRHAPATSCTPTSPSRPAGSRPGR